MHAVRIASCVVSSLGALSTAVPIRFTDAFSPQRTLVPVASQRLSQSKLSSSDRCDMSENGAKVLGVCGGIGSGKSTACKLMVDELGCLDRIDADLLAHGVYEPGSQSLKDIVAEFGDDILSSDATIDRKKLGAIVFSDRNAMSRLEQIVWPHVRTRIEEKISEIIEQNKQQIENKPDNIIIVEAALLLETDWHDLLDGLWVVQSSPSVAMQRLKDNRGLTEEEAMARINAQRKRRGTGNTDEAEYLCKECNEGIVTAVITNDGTLADLQATLKEALKNPVSFKS